MIKPTTIGKRIKCLMTINSTVECSPYKTKVKGSNPLSSTIRGINDKSKYSAS